MNATEQKRHRVVTKDLGERLDAVEPIVEAIDERLTQAFGEFDQRLHAERTHRLALAQEQRGYVDNEDRILRQTCQERWTATAFTHTELFRRLARFERLTIWERLWWLLTGRVPS